MKTNPIPLLSARGRVAFTLLFFTAVVTALGVLPVTARAQDIFVSITQNPTNTSSINEYTASGVPVSTPLVSGLNGVYGLAVSGSDLFVSEDSSYGSISEYTTSGALVNANLISGLSSADGIAISGTNMYVINSDTTIGEYTTSGAVVNATLVSGLDYPLYLAVSGSYLFVSNYEGNTIGEYNSTTGAVMPFDVAGNYPTGLAMSGSELFATISNPGSAGYVYAYSASGGDVNFPGIYGLNDPYALAVSGSDLLVSTYDTSTGANAISEYTTTGTLVNSDLISLGTGNPGIGVGIAISGTIPEPSAWPLLAGVTALLAVWCSRRQKCRRNSGHFSSLVFTNR